MRAVKNSDDKLDLLMKLTNDEGPTVLKKAITRSVTQMSDLSVYVLPLFVLLGSDELCGMMCRPQVCDIAKILFDTPGLFSHLRRAYRENVIGKDKIDGQGGVEEELCLAWFIHLCCMEFPEARQVKHDCYKIALRIIKRKHVVELCEDLKIILGLDKTEGEEGKSTSERGGEPKQASHAKTIEDLKAMAGGRHDNDLPNFRDVSVMPTVEEINCNYRPYLAGPAMAMSSCSSHVERHFRLLREDLVGPARTELQRLKRGEGDPRKRFVGLALESVDVNNKDKKKKAQVVASFDLADGHKTLSMSALKDRVAYWETYSKGMLQIDSLVLMVGPDGAEVFATVIHREACELAGSDKDYRPRVGLRLEAEGDCGAELIGSFLKFVGRGPVCKMVLITSNFFFYAPVLKVLQKKDKIALADIILNPSAYHPKRPEYLNNVRNLETLFPTTLNPSQKMAMENAFGSELALVQGPPGTGKTYIERAIIELIYQHTNEVILLEAYTNHALDQVLEGLLDKGITEIVRIGGRSKSKRLEPFNIRNLVETRKALMPSGFKRRAATLYQKREVAETEAGELAKRVNMNSQSASWNVMSDFLRTNFSKDFKELDCQHHCGGGSNDGFQMVGKDGKRIKPCYLWDLWRKGEPVGQNYNKNLFKHAHSPDSIWKLSKTQRLVKIQDWVDSVTEEDRVSLAVLLEEIREIDEELRTLHKEPMYEILLDKKTRIIGITSSGASLYADMLATVKPGVVIVEEAGELLEALVLAGTHKSAKHMVLIGDHKQLRPKIENHKLSVVSGNGHDLDYSLFERLVRGGLQHSTLLEQHRMHPEIAALIMELGIYPGLINYPQTDNRERIRGVAKRVCFIDHREMEHQQKARKAQTDTSHSNMHEAKMCAYICRYLIQQGYKGKEITVLTTYVGQVVEINQQLSKVMRIPVDIDERDLKDLMVRGIDVEVQSRSGQRPNKKKNSRVAATIVNGDADDHIRVSTVDNYQGEENKIIVVSLVRSNVERQIGFLKEPERLTVLLSRAQCQVIVIGNGECLRNAKNAKGAELWDRLLSFMEKQGQVGPGLPVKCASHEHCNMLQKMEDFEKIAPNGGCTLECTAKLACGHRCPLKCHGFDSEHKSVYCKVQVSFTCRKGHKVFGVCSDVAEMGCSEVDTSEGSRDLTDVTCDYCKVCNKIARIEKATEKEIALIKAAGQEKLRQEDLKQASAEREIEQERARLHETRETTERMRARDKQVLSLEKIKRERELEEFCRDDELERLVREDKVQMELDLAESERQIAMKSDALAKKVQELQEQRCKREEDRDSCEQHLHNRMHEAQLRGEESSRQATVDTEVSAEDLAPLFIDITNVLKKKGVTAGKKVDLIQTILDVSSHSSALNLLAKGLGMRSVAELKSKQEAGKHNTQMQTLLDDVAGGKGWIEVLRRIKPQLSGSASCDPELELFHHFVTLQIFSGTHSDAELAKCRDCLKKYAGASGSITVKHKKQQCTVPQQVLPDSRNSVVYLLLSAALSDAESQGKPSLAALKAALQLMLHPDMKRLSGITDFCVGYLCKHVDVMIVNGNPTQMSANGTPTVSVVEQQQERRRMNARRSKALTALENMVGLEKIKILMAQMSARIDLDRERGVDVKKQQMNMQFCGNPGTGKTTVARIYGEFLKEKGVLGTDAIFRDTSGAKLIADGGDKLKKLIEEEMKVGGVLFIDEAYQLNPKTNPMGGQILDYLLPEIENRRGTLVVVIAGYSKPMDDLMSFNEGLPSRFPEQFVFEDYTEKELLQILTDLVREGSVQWKLADEKHARIAARRMARQSGTIGFGNARAMRNLLDLSLKRQAARVLEERQQGLSPDVFLIERSDLLGPKGLDVGRCEALAKLQGMYGLNMVKQAVEQLIKLVETNAELEDQEKKILDVTLNKVFFGNPGTGKTTVAKIYGGILKAMGLLTKGDVIVKIPQDFIGEALGQSEAKTKAILDNAKGCVLVIDEAYGLHSGENMNDPYKIAVVNTIVAEVQGVPGDDRCVLLLGYKDEMEEMMRNANPGLARRFNLQDAFHFEDYNDEDLLNILRGKVKQLDMDIDLGTALEVVKILADQRRTELHFGNAGAVDNLLSLAKQGMMTRMKECTTSQIAQAGIKLHASDFYPSSDSTEGAVNYSLDRILQDPSGFIDERFSGLIGCDSVKNTVKQFISTIAFAQEQGHDPLSNIELNFFFSGPPGTGKTTVARIMGKLLKALGLMAKGKVTECSASDLVTGYAGQASKQTREVFRKALGGVLFIDEAYRLHPEKGGPYMREVLDEVVQILTEPDFKNNMAVIIAGYEEDMAMLFQVNPGLKSRIQTTVKFEQLNATDSEIYLRKKLQQKEIQVSPQLEDGRLRELCEKLVVAPHWSNGRDVDTLATNIYQKHAQWIIMSQSSNTMEVIASNNEQHDISLSPTTSIGSSSTPKQTGSGVTDDNVIHVSVIEAAFHEMIDQKESLTMEPPGLDQVMRKLDQLKMTQNMVEPPTASVSSVAQFSDAVPQALGQILEPETLACADILDEEVLNHFVKFDTDFLLSIQQALEGLGVDVNNLEHVANFDIQKLLAKFGKNFDLVKEWHRKIHDVWEQAKRMESELARKKRAQRPKWRCAICRRPNCQVAPYIEGYEDVEW